MKKLLFVLLITMVLAALAACQTPVLSTPTISVVPSATPSPIPLPSPSPAPTPTPAPTPENGHFSLVNAYTKLAFSQPLIFCVDGSGSKFAYVVEKQGRIKIFEDSSDTANADIYLDITDRVLSSGSEQGLLGLVFDPEYKTNGYFYVNYTNKSGTVISRFSLSTNNSIQYADPSSEKVLLTFAQPYQNHNGGCLAFGPDGHLYIAAGDGGSGGDPKNNGQNLSVLLGKILRIDVHPSDSSQPYSIPVDNPFAGNTQGYKEEIYAYGLRNPWRFSFSADGQLWAADVGQDKIEEINLIKNGGNYGWSAMEGTQTYKDVPGINTADLIAPVWEYPHAPDESITGGYVYAGKQTPSLTATYVYGDYVSGRIWALWLDDAGKAHNTLILDSSINISSFGVDAAGELRIVDLNGSVYRLVE